jgi:branched-chain amino acid transport system substrate-binding protein
MRTRIKWLSPAFFAALLLASILTAVQPARAAGVTDTEIRIGNIMPYTGPLAAFASIGRAEAAYFEMINERGGINGRKVKFISRDESENGGRADP